MATAPERVHESTIGVGQAHWTALLEYLDELSPWLVVAVVIAVHGIALAGAGLLTLYLAEVLSGRVGVVVIFTGGVSLIAAAPTVVSTWFERTLDAYESQ